MPDRYADAVRARRAELRRGRTALVGGHRVELRAALALARSAVLADAGAELTALRHEADARIDHADHAGRVALPGPLVASARQVERRAHDRWGVRATAAARRAVVARGLPVHPGWPVLGGPPVHPDPPSPTRVRPVEVLTDPAAWRLAVLPTALLPVVLLPLFGLPAAAAPTLLPPAIGLGVLLLVGVARARYAALHRARLRAFTEVLVAGVRRRLDADVGRCLLELENAVSAHLDAELARRRAAVDAELALLAPEVFDAPA